jgi:hypothetical protein
LSRHYDLQPEWGDPQRPRHFAHHGEPLYWPSAEADGHADDHAELHDASRHPRPHSLPAGSAAAAIGADEPIEPRPTDERVGARTHVQPSGVRAAPPRKQHAYAALHLAPVRYHQGTPSAVVTHP